MDSIKSTNVFVLIPGAWHSVDYLKPMQDYLREMGYDSIAVGHKHLDPEPGTCVFDDAKKVENIVKEVLNAGKNVVIVMHSYGGAVGSQAIGHLLSTMQSSPSDDAEPSHMGKVLRLVYVSALIPREGETMEDLNKLVSSEFLNPVEKKLPLKLVDGKVVCREEAKDLFYHDLPDPDRNKYYNLLQAAPATAPPKALSHFGWRYVPSTYVCATKDRILSWSAQHYIWNTIKEALKLHAAVQSVDSTYGTVTCSFEDVSRQQSSETPGFFAVEKIDSDHCSMFILRKHVEILGSILIEIVEPERRNVKRPHVVKKDDAE